ncbi:FAR1 DNA binding domain [Macleaya cordata]|uniref:FAR1 DNA binding domain n=1 Tax=Macleaya cordata TaxID=56857 RepID=A0A200Q288_MACCD|nr:FAR1 DNA binding domain [Macleaya cordata]
MVGVAVVMVKLWWPRGSKGDGDYIMIPVLFLWLHYPFTSTWMCVMENSIGQGQGIDLDESDGGLQDATYDEHETEDELSRDLDSCTGGNDRTVEGSVEKLSTYVDASEPNIGMEFKSKDDAREFYVSYGRRTGFTIRIHHNRRSRITNAVISQDFVCSKEGFRAKKYENRRDRVLPPPPVTREGCHAMLRVTLKEGGKWVVTKFVRDHSHKLLSPGKVPWRRSDKILVGEDEKDKKIRELSNELDSERRRCKRQCAVYQEQLQMVLKDIEHHSDHLSRTVQNIVMSIKEIEDQ